MRAASSSSSPRAAAAASPAPPLPPPPPRLACLVKLGGALITDKSRNETLRPGALREAARHLAIAYKQSSSSADGGGLVVVHGAGSFGHPAARHYRVARGGDLSKDAFLREGLCVTRLRVSRLHNYVLEALLEAGVPATGLPPFAAPWGPTSGPGNVAPERAAEACARVADCLRAGLVPVLYGDCVLDARQGCSVLSGDAIMRELARGLRPSRAVFLTDVDGVFDRPPEEAGARLVRAVRLGGGGGVDGGGDEWVLEGEEDEGEEETGVGGGPGAGADGGAAGSGGVRLGGVRLGGSRAGAADVSGGMGAKVEEAACISREAGGAPVVVAKGGTEAALQALLRGADAFALASGPAPGGSGERLRATVVTARFEK